MRSLCSHLASFPEHNPNPIVEADAEGRVRYANPVALSLFPELVLQGPAHPWLADWPAVMLRLKAPFSGNTDRRTVIVGARVYHQTLRLMPEEGSIRMYGLEITDRVRAEEAALEAHDRTSAILESIADAFYSLDDEWRFTAVNPAAERAPFGRPASELLGKVIWEVFPQIPGTRVHQHYLDAVGNRSQEHYEAPSPLNGRWYEVFMFPRSGGLDVYLRDIDDRKKVEAALKESEERFRTLASNAQDSIARFDREGRYLYVNPFVADRLALPAEEIIGRTTEELGRNTEIERWEARVQEVSQTGNPQRFDRQSIDGRWYDVQLMPELRDGTVETVLAISRDITDRKRAEESLREKEATLSAILNAATESIWLFSVDGVALSANRTALERWGRPPETVIGRSIPEFLSGELASARLARFQEVAHTGRPVEFEDLRAGIRFEHTFYPVFGEDGRVDRIAVFSRDVTKSRQTEAALRRYELLASQSSDIVLFIRREDGRILEANAAAIGAYGYSREEILTLSIQNLRAPHTIPLTDEQMAIADDKGILFETVHQHKDGRTFPVEVSSRGALVSGERTLMSVVRDITERKRLERLYAVLSQVNEAIVRTRDEKTLYREVCRIVAEEGDFPLAWIGQVEGRKIVPMASGGKETAYLSEIRVEVEGELGTGPTGTCVRENRPVVNDDFATNPSTSAWREPALGHGFRASAAFPLHKQGKTIGALTLYAKRNGVFDSAERKLIEALCADLSYAIAAMEHERERTQIEEALRTANARLLAADQHKNEFLAALSHELRNPLAPIRNSLFVLDRAAPDSEQAKRSREIIGRQTDQLARLVDDLLDVTRISHNKIQLRRVPLDLNDLVSHTVDDHRSLFVEKGIELEVSLAAQRLHVDGDQARLAQIVGNLLHNAAKYTPAGQNARVETKSIPARRRAQIRIADSGVGIEPSVLRRLFQPFIQAAATLDRSQGGLGLGLALVRGLVELHGGEVCAHSDGPGKGAEFIVELPLEEAREGETSPGVATKASGRRRVLIIEDNLDAAQSLREVLEFGEHIVEVAHTGPEGLSKARQLWPEVVLCDIGLPGMDGYQVARAFRSDEALKYVFLVALSGYTLPEDLQRAREAGFDRHVAKPPSLERLEELLRDLRGGPGADS